MAETAAPQPTPEEMEVLETLVFQLRRKQGTWLDWGRHCQRLQQAGWHPQRLFEETGFEPIHQNQLIVAAQVYGSLEKAGAAEAVRSHFAQRGSDVLYELRVLSQQGRADAATLAVEHGIDAESIRDVVKALKEYSYFKAPPAPFTAAPGDGVAYWYWLLARQQADLQARSRLIAQGLRFAVSAEARQAIETLLVDFAVVKARSAPTFPIYRLETDSDLPFLVPIVGQWPLTSADLQGIAPMEPEEPFGIIRVTTPSAWAPVPGWQVLLQAEDPVGIVARGEQFPQLANQSPQEPILLLIDRDRRTWDEDGYFLTATPEGTLDLSWFPQEPATKLLGRLILFMRPKRILDEDYTRELYQFEE